MIDALGDALPSEVTRRRKQGFVIPYEVWMRGALKPRLHRILSNPDIASGIGLRPDRVRSIWSQFLQGSRRINMQHPFALYVLMDWCYRHRVTL